MKRKLNKGCSLILAASMIFSAMPVRVSAEINTKENAVENRQIDGEAEYAEGEAIILYKSSQTATQSIKSQTATGSGIELAETYDFGCGNTAKAAKSNVSGAEGFSVSLVKSNQYTTKELIEKLETNKNIKYVEPNYRIKAMNTDTYSDCQWALDNRGQNGGIEGLDINADNEVLKTETNSEEKVIALVDTGIDYKHEDLEDVMWNNPINSKKLKGLHGYDFSNGDDDPMDDNGHGTHCAGIMAGKADNGKGISGVATSDNIKLMALKILDADGYAYGMEAVGAYNYIYKAQREGINVVAVNNSWGASGDGKLEILNELMYVVGENGAVSVCAAGNEDTDNDNVYTIPAGFDNPYIISVAASNEKDELAAFSNYGKKSVDIAAPGTNILSTVNVDTFNPGIYEDKDSLCQLYEGFEGKELIQTMDEYGYTGKNAGKNQIAYGISGSGNADSEVTIVNDTYFGKKEEQSASIEWKVTGAEFGDRYVLYLPYEAVASENELYSSVMVSVSGPKGAGEDIFASDLSTLIVADSTINSEGIFNEASERIFDVVYVNEGNYWTHFSGSATSNVVKDGKRAIAVYLCPGEAGDYMVHVDEMGISAPDATSEEFGKYDYYNGTSMATPFVTGAVAAIANIYQEETPGQWKARILGSIRKTEELEEKLATGGVLDLSNVDNPGMLVESMQYSGNLMVINGYYLDDAVVTINGEIIKPNEQDELTIIIDVSEYANQYIDIEVSKNENVYHDGCFVATGESYEEMDEFEAFYDGGTVASDGDKIYYINNQGNVYEGTPQRDNSLSWKDMEMSYSLEMFGEEYCTLVDYQISNMTAVVSSNKTLYTVLKLDAGYSEERILAVYDSRSGWRKVAELPDEVTALEGFTLASYNGSIYILGGLDIATGVYSDKVYSCNLEKKTWIEESAMPKGRCFAKAVQVNGNLVVTLGGEADSEDMPENFLYDGKKWTVAKADIGVVYNSKYYGYMNTEEEYAEIIYYDAGIGIVEEGIIYSNLEVAELGDTFIYDMEQDVYVPTDYSLANSCVYGDTILATTVKDSLYLLYGYSYVEEEFEFWSVGKKDVWDILEGLFEEENGYSENSYVGVCRVPVESGSIYVKDGSTSGGTVSGSGYYLPGDTIILSADVINNYFMKSFTVDGQAVEANESGKYEWTGFADKNGKEILACVSTGAYVSSITMPVSADIKQGESIELSAKANPSYAEDKELVWTSDNSAMVTVDSTGKITAATTAKEGTKITIKAVAKDRGTISATCVVTVRKAEASENKNQESQILPKKGSTVTSGKLIYKIVKNSKSEKTVTCIGAKNKKINKVTIPAEVTIAGCQFKVIGIGKNAFRNCKKLKKVTIGKNVTRIEKNAFRNCSTLSKVIVKSAKIKKVGTGSFYGSKKKISFKYPAKQKKKYRNMINKAMK